MTTQQSTRPDNLHHRASCARPGWTTSTPPRAGWQIVTCTGCGIARIVPADRTPQEPR